MAEWTKAAVLTTAVGFNAHRGFESLSLRLLIVDSWPLIDTQSSDINLRSAIANRQSRRGGARVADWGRLLSGCRGKNLDRGFESRPPRLKTQYQ